MAFVFAGKGFQQIAQRFQYFGSNRRENGGFYYTLFPEGITPLTLVRGLYLSEKKGKY